MSTIVQDLKESSESSQRVVTENIQPTQISQKINKLRCHHCKKRVTAMNAIECRCGNTYCFNDRYSYAHNCTFNYVDKQKEELQKNLVKVTKDKIPDRI